MLMFAAGVGAMHAVVVDYQLAVNEEARAVARRDAPLPLCIHVCMYVCMYMMCVHIFYVLALRMCVRTFYDICHY
jgi:hypothetical protein